MLAKCHAPQPYSQRSGSSTQRNHRGPDSIGTEDTARLCSNRNVLCKLLMGFAKLLQDPAVNALIIQYLQTQIKKERNMSESFQGWCSRM